MPGVYAQRLCTMQSQPSIHSLSPGERGFRQGCRNKDTPSFKHGCLQVVEQSRCRTHRQQTTTVAQMQSHQSVLKGIGIINQKFILKTDFFYKLRGRSKTPTSKSVKKLFYIRLCYINKLIAHSFSIDEIVGFVNEQKV